MQLLPPNTELLLGARRRKGRLVLLLLGGICLLPVVAASLIYTLALPIGSLSYGQLLATRPFAGRLLQGWPAGKWVLVNVELGDCGADCQHRRFTLQQICRAVGEAAAKLAAVMIMTKGQIPVNNINVFHAPELAALALPVGFYLVDPLGNQVMFYPNDADPTKVIREVGYLLKTNNALG